MAKLFKRIGIDLIATAGSDVRVKVSLNDTTSGFLNDKISLGSGKLTKNIANPAANETLQLDVDETNIDHNVLTNYEIDQHRTMDDALTTTSNLWSADKIQSELDDKINKISDPVADNRLTKTVGLDGANVEQTGISVDDSDNVSGINNLEVNGNLTVNGTTTSVNTDTLDVEDPNITVNKNGTQASADLADAGFTVEMSDATDAAVGYDSTTTSKFKMGEVGDLREVVTVTHTQEITNKTINANSNTITNLKHGVEVNDPSSDVHGVGVGNDVVGTGTTQTLGNKTIDGTSATGNNTVTIDSDNATYDNTTSGLTATNAQDAIDELDSTIDTIQASYVESFNTRTGAVVPAASDYDADQIDYDNATSGLTATDAQAAIDEVDSNVDGIDTRVTAIESSYVESFNSRTGTVVPAASDYDADQIDYDNTTSGLTATNAQAAIDELNTEINNKSSFDLDSTASISNNQTTPIDVTGFNVSTANGFTATVNVNIDATSDRFETFTIQGSDAGSNWNISIDSLGDSGMNFSITPAGQLQYTNEDYAGFNLGTITFKAIFV
jgi:hypothetical protein